MTTPMPDHFPELLSRRNHMSTAKAVEINFCRAAEVHLPDQIVRNKLDYMMVWEPDDLHKAQFSLRNTVQCDSNLLASIRTGRFVTGGQYSSHI